MTSELVGQIKLYKCHLHLDEIQSQREQDHLQMWCGRSNSIPIAMHSGCMYTCPNVFFLILSRDGLHVNAQ